ncbi:DUF1835 domain-containing protein [Cohnella faecalis]|nr:DUF1835 domain-containing protein [Cohnella faecalis]
MDKLLHILNGDVALRALGEAGIRGERLVWREIYTAGPLCADLLDDAARSTRAAWLEEAYGIPGADYSLGCERQQKQAIEAVEAGRTLAIWLDPDLFDQAIWMAVSSLLVPYCWKAFIVPLPYGPCDAARMEESWQRKSEISATELEAGARAWEAYCSLSPERIEHWLQADGELLPETADALRFHLLRYPGEDGLGIVERLTLRALSGDERNGLPLAELFRSVSEQAPLFGMGDLQYWRIVERLATGPSALLRLESGGTKVYGLPKLGAPPDYSAKLEPFGREVLEGTRKAEKGMAEVHTFTGSRTL